MGCCTRTGSCLVSSISLADSLPCATATTILPQFQLYSNHSKRSQGGTSRKVVDKGSRGWHPANHGVRLARIINRVCHVATELQALLFVRIAFCAVGADCCRSLVLVLDFVTTRLFQLDASIPISRVTDSIACSSDKIVQNGPMLVRQDRGLHSESCIYNFRKALRWSCYRSITV
jgi:hypothetical protein